VNAGVGAAGALNDDSLLRDLARSRVKRALNRRHARLELPAVEAGAVVGDGEFDVAHACERIIARASPRGNDATPPTVGSLPSLP
jgi:hypothetical protein